jgi:TP901 family phage tail tape measure protein
MSISATQLGLGVAAVGAVITAGFTLPLIDASIESAKMAMEFETAMVKIETLSGVSAEAVAQMSKEVLDLGVASGVGPQELAKALLVVTSTGIRGKEAMEILTASAKGTAVGMGDTAQTARAITAAITAYGKENLNAATAANQLFIAVREGGAEATNFASTLGRVFGVAAQLGVGFDEVTASVATFTRLGVNAAEAVTALRGTLNVMLHPAKQTQEALEKLGTSAEELRKSIREKGCSSPRATKRLSVRSSRTSARSRVCSATPASRRKRTRISSARSRARPMALATRSSGPLRRPG